MTAGSDARGRIRKGLKLWFRTPPRRHGEVVYTREVSFLELFYDLVYVVVIGRAAHHLAEHVDWGGVRRLRHRVRVDLGSMVQRNVLARAPRREDGRSRLYIFLQMGLLALLAVFAGEAVGEDGPAFAITYAILFALFTYQWYLVHRIDDPQYRPTTTRYLVGMLVTVIAVSGQRLRRANSRGSGSGRLLVILWVVGRSGPDGDISHRRVWRRCHRDRSSSGWGSSPSSCWARSWWESSPASARPRAQTAKTITTGLLGLTIGMGMWWNYFDMLGRRVPAEHGGRLAGWLFSHLPLTMAIAAGGAAMVSLVEHAAEARTPTATAWLLSGSVALMLAGVTLAARALAVDEFPQGMARQIAPTFGLAAAVILVLGAARPPPIVFVVAIGVVLSLTWLWLFVLFLALGGVPPSMADQGEMRDG